MDPVRTGSAPESAVLKDFETRMLNWRSIYLNFFWIGFFAIAEVQTEQQYRRVGSTSALYMAFRRKADRPPFFPTYERMAKNIFLAWRSL